MNKWTEATRREFGQRLAAAREHAEKTQTDLGAIFDLGKAAVSAWETGKSVPSIEQVVRLCRELGTPLEWLALGASPPPPFSAEVTARLLALAPDELRRAENAVRAALDMPTLQASPQLPVGKRPARAA